MPTVQEEFAKQAAAFVQIIRDMIGAGQLGEAGQLLDQYSVLNPTDPQIGELRGLISGDEGNLAGERADTRSAPTAGQGDGTSGELLAHTTPNSARPAFLDNVNCVFIIDTIGMKRTGFFNSLFYKIKLMEDKLGYSGTILTCKHNLDLRKTEVWLKTFLGDSEIMSHNTKIRNVYEHYQKSFAPELENKAIFSRDSSYDGLTYKKVKDGVYGADDGDNPKRMDIYSGYQGCLRMERHFEGKKVTKDVYYDDWGYVNCVREYGEEGKDEESEEDVVSLEVPFCLKHYTTDGKLCIEAFYDFKIIENEPYKILLYDDDGELISEFGSNFELAAYYLKTEMADDKFYMLDFEGGMEAKIAGFLNRTHHGKNTAKLCVIHSIFLIDAYKPNLGPQKFYEFVCGSPGAFDGIRFLTKAARRDFNKMYGHSKNSFVIGHPYPFDIVKTDIKERDLRKAVVVARLFPEKQLDITVSIFAKVVEALPDVKLEIYGTGTVEEDVRKLIRDLKMENNIFLMGYTDDALSVYRSAALSITTSRAEGYGLSIMESICNGCPAFARDIKYGPSEIIKNGETGFYFKRNDFMGFARKLADFFNNPQLIEKMSENCYADAERFGRERFLEKWLEMAETVYERKMEVV